MEGDVTGPPLALEPRSDDARTYGEVITDALRTPKSEIYGQLAGVENQFDPPTKPVYKEGIYLGTLHPKRAYREGFFKPLVAKPYPGLLSIVHFDPSAGQSSTRTDDAARADVAKRNHSSMRQMTMRQRRDRIKSLIDGTFNFVPASDGELVLRIFRTTMPAARQPDDSVPALERPVTNQGTTQWRRESWQWLRSSWRSARAR